MCEPVRVRRRLVPTVFLLVMAALIVGLDVAFLSHHFVTRLLVNIAIVVVFVWVYVRFGKRWSPPGGDDQDDYE